MTDGPRDIPGADVWVLTDGKAGHENQCLGLAAALGADPAVKKLSPRFPWSRLPPQFWLSPLRAADPDGTILAPPWPDILIAAGRSTVAPALAVKKASGGKTFCVQVQDPVFGRDRFDLLAVPRHDGVSGDNVVQTAGALTRITADSLSAAADRFRDTFAMLPRPLIAVLVGGSNGQYRMTDDATARLAAGLRKLAAGQGAGLAITASRRTGEDNEARLRAGLGGTSWWFWDGRGDNPYLGLLALADAIVVTADSVSMVSEAVSTGKPVYIADLDGGSAKFDRFHENLRRAGMTRTFDGKLESWSYDVPGDTAAVADEIRRRYGLFASGPTPP